MQHAKRTNGVSISPAETPQETQTDRVAHRDDQLVELRNGAHAGDRRTKSLAEELRQQIHLRGGGREVLARVQAARRDAELTHVLVVHKVFRPLRPLLHLLLLLRVCSCLRLLLLQATGEEFAGHEALLAAHCVPVAGREAAGEGAVKTHRAPAFVKHSVDLIARCGSLETLFAVTKGQLPRTRFAWFI